jgi:2',3'-cyclic-nucleotide 2'-phosphodiesterase (5'-nucleotidase family)
MSFLKRRPLSLAGALTALAFTSACTEPDEPRPEPEPQVPSAAYLLQVLHASDMESGVPAIDDAPRFSAVLKTLETQYPNTLKLASGDAWLPGVFFNAGGDPAMSAIPAVGAASQGRADIAMLNEMGFHAASFGNHEFDSGPREIANILRASGAWSGTKFPYLSANLDFKNSDLAGQVVPEAATLDASNPGTSHHNKISASVIYNVNGEKIGLVGATTPQLPRISSPGTVITKPDDFNDYDALAAIIQPYVDRVIAQGANKVILMAHMQQYDIEVNQLPQRLTGVDIIVAGGNHAVWADTTDALYGADTRELDYPQWKTSKSNEPVAVLNVASNWRYVGRFVAPFNEQGVLIPEIAQRSLAINGAYATDEAGVQRLAAASRVDAEVKAVAEGVKGVVLAKDGNIAGKSQVYLNGLRPSVRTEETNLGNITCDASLWAARQKDTSTTLCVKNGGGIRDSIGTVGTGANPTYGPPAANPAANKREGEISQLDIENSLRFNNDLSLVTLTASQLKEVLEHGVATVAPGFTDGRFPQVGGLRFEYDASKTAQVLEIPNKTFAVITPGERVRKLVIVNEAGDVVDTVVENGALVGDANRTFRLVTLSFLATQSGDNYPFLRYASENAARFNLVSLDETTGDQGFNDAGREQKAFYDYLKAFYSTSSAGYGVQDTPKATDARIKPL